MTNKKNITINEENLIQLIKDFKDKEEFLDDLQTVYNEEFLEHPKMEDFTVDNWIDEDGYIRAIQTYLFKKKIFEKWNSSVAKYAISEDDSILPEKKG